MSTAQMDDLREPPVLDIDPYAISTLENPYPFQAALREAGPVVYLPMHGVYAVGRFAEAQRVISDWEHFTNAGGIGIQDIRKPGDFRIPSLILEVDPPDHTRVRGPLTRILSPLVIRKWREGFERDATALVEKLLDQRDIDGVEDLAEAYVLKVFPDAVGVRLPRIPTLAIGEMRFNQSGPQNELYHRAMKIGAPHLEWFEQSVQRAGVVPGGLSELLFEAEDKGEFPPGVASNLIRAFVGGGTDSTISGIGATLGQLARQPAQWDILRADPSKVRAAFEEGIRFDPPFQVTYRTTRNATELSGFRLAADTKIGVFLGAANRDPTIWKHPDRYDLTRPVKSIAFGSGVHVCIGQMIARLEADTLLTALAKRVKSIELTGIPRYRLMNQVRTLDHLPLRLTAAD
jgi:cytochrome P450